MDKTRSLYAIYKYDFHKAFERVAWLHWPLRESLQRIWLKVWLTAQCCRHLSQITSVLFRVCCKRLSYSKVRVPFVEGSVCIPNVDTRLTRPDFGIKDRSLLFAPSRCVLRKRKSSIQNRWVSPEPDAFAVHTFATSRFVYRNGTQSAKW